MANGTPAPGKKKADAARAEAAGGLRTVETQGLTLTIPAKLPFAVLRFLEGDPGPAEIVGILEAILRPREQIEQVWAADLDIEQGTELVTDLITAAGLTLGESKASQDS